jgi:hypothetical protein
MRSRRTHFVVVFLICLSLVMGGCQESTPRLEVTVEVVTKAAPTATAPAATATPTVEPTKPPGPTLLNPTNAVAGPRKQDPMSVAADAEGNVHVAWYVEPLADSRVLYQKWAEGSWADSIEIGAGRAPLVAAGDGSVYVLGDDAAGDGQGFVYSNSTDGGDSWSELQTISIADVSPANAEYAILIDKAGHLHMAWSQFRDPGRSDLFYSWWDGDSWSEPILISDGGQYANRPSLATTEAGGIHFVWLSNAGGQYDVYHRYWDGATWSTAVRVNGGGRKVEYYTLGVDKRGQLHLAWYEFHGPANSEVYHSWWNGDTWAQPVNVSHDEEASEAPLFLVGESETVHLVWLQPAGREGTIKHSQWDGNGWSEPEGVIPPAFILNLDDAAIGQEGDLYLLWRSGGETRDVQLYNYSRWDGVSPATPNVLGGIGQWAYLGLIKDSRGNVYSVGLNVGFNRPEISPFQESKE